MVNLMDSPGHVDFSSEVSTAVRLCDGAVLVVDVVEGVQPQTKVVLKQAWDEGIKPVLALNKLDRLVLEMKLDPLAAYHHIMQVLEQVNALVAEMFTEEVLAKSNEARERKADEVLELGVEDVYDWSSGLDEADDSSIYFAPEMGNVVFCSAVDGWAFSLSTFASIYSKKLGFSKSVLQRTLWGDFHINMKAKKIYSGASAKAKKPLFVSLVLENIWAVYEAVVVRKDKERLEKIVSSLSLSVAARDLRSTDSKQQLAAVFSAWLPLAAAILSMVVNRLPSPAHLGPDRAEKLLCSRTKKFSSLPTQTQQLREHFVSCSPAGPTIVFISKMFPVARAQLPEHKVRPLSSVELAERREEARARHQERQQGAEQSGAGVVELSAEQVAELADRAEAGAVDRQGADTAFLAFARVYSGCLEPGQPLWAVGPKHDPALAATALEAGDAGMGGHAVRVNPGSLYILLGRDLESVDRVPAGNIVGIAGLQDAVLKSATLSSSPWCPPFVPLVQSSVPILRVALEPARSSDLPRLQAGLQLLNQADAHVEVLVSEAGEHLLVTAGEVHLQRCLADLTMEYAGCEISVSDPIVPFRETIVRPPETDMVNEAVVANEGEESVGELVMLASPDQSAQLAVRALPLPAELCRLLDQRGDLLRAAARQTGGSLSNASQADMSQLREQINR